MNVRVHENKKVFYSAVLIKGFFIVRLATNYSTLFIKEFFILHLEVDYCTLVIKRAFYSKIRGRLFNGFAKTFMTINLKVN